MHPIRQILPVIFFALWQLAIMAYFLVTGRTYIAAIFGTIAIVIVIYFLFPDSSLTEGALRDRSAKLRPGESWRRFHLRVAAYWWIATGSTIGLFVGGAWLAQLLPNEVTQSGIWAAIFIFMAPLLGATFALKGIGGLWRAARNLPVETGIRLTDARGNKMKSPYAAVIVGFDQECVWIHWPGKDIQMVRWTALTAVAIETTDQGPFTEDVWWHLTSDDQFITYPSEATGAEEMLGRLQQLPAFNNEYLIQAMSSTDNRMFLLWEHKGRDENYHEFQAEKGSDPLN